MRVPNEYYDVFVVHVGPQVRDMYTEPVEAVKHVRRLVEAGEPAEFEAGIQNLTRKCFDRGRGSKITLTMVEAHRELEKLDSWLDAWRKLALFYQR